MEKSYILAIDQGTSSSKVLLFNKKNQIVHTGQKELNQYFPKAGWVEQDAMEIWNSVQCLIDEILKKAKIPPEKIAAIGITNQRESSVIWDKNTGLPIYKAIVWQSRQSNNICRSLKERGYEDLIKDKTGLVLDPYFSASKIRWILDKIPEAERRAENGELLFGTIDSWLIWKLSEGKAHITDPSNASRSLIYNIHEKKWDKELLEIFNISEKILPRLVPSSAISAHTSGAIFMGASIPIAGIAGDQQAALFGQECYTEGMAKNTYGTGCFMLMNTGKRAVKSRHGLLTTIAWEIDGEVQYALEGSVFIAGSAIKWLRDGLSMIKEAAESEDYALAVPDTRGVYLVPSFVGLGTPYWDAEVKGAVFGLTEACKKEHFIRAALESLAYQSRDLFLSMKKDSKLKIPGLRVDGGASENNFLMQFQSDILGIPLYRPASTESTAMGAAHLAGLASSFWKNKEEIWQERKIDRFTPEMPEEKAAKLCLGWEKAIRATRAFK